MNREKWYEVTFFTNKPQEAIEKLGADFTGKIDNLKVTEIKSQITPMNREKLEAEIFDIINSSCEHKNTPLEDSCGFCRIYQRRTKYILTAIDAYLEEVTEKQRQRISEDMKTRFIHAVTYYEKEDLITELNWSINDLLRIIKEQSRANIHPSATKET